MDTPASRYRIVSEVGRGGMGHVHLADDCVLDRKVALKFLAPEDTGDERARRRLLDEATAAAHLDHPFICKIYEVGERDGQPFIAMEYLEGETLKERLTRGPIPIPEALRLVAEMADALECAEQHGIVHRDLKPANVMLTRDGHVKLMDFGIAKRVAGEPVLTRTATAELKGTLAYMSPEQLRGLPLDSRSDIYAFGLVLWEMLTGVHPFANESPIGTAFAIVHEPAPTLDRHLSDAPAPLTDLLTHMLATDRDARTQSFREVRRDLESFVAVGATAALATRRPWAARRVATALVLVGVLLAVIVWLSAIWMSGPALAFNERDWIVVADVENLTGDAVFNRSLSMALMVGLAQSKYVNVLPTSRVRQTLQRMQRTADERLDEELAAEVAVREGAKGVLACSIAQVGDVYSLTARLIDPHSQTTVLTRSARADTRDAVLPALDRLATDIRQQLGESLNQLSQDALPLPQATTASLEALKLFTDARRSDDATASRALLEQAVALDPDFALAHARLGQEYYLLPNRDLRMRGEEHLTKALRLLGRLSTRERLWITALAQDSRGNRESAVTAYKTYLAAYPDDGDAWFRLGWTYMATLGEPDMAVEAFGHVIALDPGNTRARINLATSYAGLGRFQEARQKYEEAFAADPTEIMGIFVNHEYGFLLVKLGEPDAAAAVFEKMATSSDSGQRARGQRSVALLQMYRGQYRAATGTLRQAILTNETNGARVSEFRDRLFLATALGAQGRERELDAEIARVERLVPQLSLSPEWLRLSAKLFVRYGHLRQARALLALMDASTGDPTNASSANRDRRRDPAHVLVARGEIALATGRAGDALPLIESAYQLDPSPATRESLAAACLAGGRLDEAAQHYEAVIAAQRLGNEDQEYWVLAHLRLAEVRERQGDAKAAHALYERVLALWKDADPDLPARRQAQDGLARTAAPGAV